MNWLIEYPNGKTDLIKRDFMAPDIDDLWDFVYDPVLQDFTKDKLPPALSACGEPRFCYTGYDNASK